MSFVKLENGTALFAILCPPVPPRGIPKNGKFCELFLNELIYLEVILDVTPK